ncbi:hypothetical protein DAMNIGENAA_21840 [Desulforhabdus amnigena]|uniref:Uncharacterized protein n=1 Tax=Desulforhabdus amnigena TaxID=40218 RepID=A0A9W6D6P7_9BACT|nr:hypothetical protein DAMNIGENAA_21840 [Desulforhabdus amnigena]
MEEARAVGMDREGVVGGPAVWVELGMLESGGAACAPCVDKDCRMKEEPPVWSGGVPGVGLP